MERGEMGMLSPGDMPPAPPPMSWGMVTSTGTPRCDAAPSMVMGSHPQPATSSKGSPYIRDRFMISPASLSPRSPMG